MYWRNENPIRYLHGKTLYAGNIYTMDKEETPLLYAMGIKNDFKTLNILSSQIVKEENISN